MEIGYKREFVVSSIINKLYIYFFIFLNSGYIFFFFFQAEDGIRARNVTGVQTCALPISYWLSGFPSPRGGASSGERKPGVPAVVESPRPTIVRGRGAMDRPPDSPARC